MSEETQKQAVRTLTARVGYGAAQAADILRDASAETLAAVAGGDAKAIDEVCAAAEQNRIEAHKKHLEKLRAEKQGTQLDPAPPAGEAE